MLAPDTPICVAPTPWLRTLRDSVATVPSSMATLNTPPSKLAESLSDKDRSLSISTPAMAAALPTVVLAARSPSTGLALGRSSDAPLPNTCWAMS